MRLSTAHRRYAMKSRLLPSSSSFLSFYVVYFLYGPPGFPCFALRRRRRQERRDGHNNLYAWRVYICGCTGKPVCLTISHACVYARPSLPPPPRTRTPLYKILLSPIFSNDSPYARSRARAAPRTGSSRTSRPRSPPERTRRVKYCQGDACRGSRPSPHTADKRIVPMRLPGV